MASIVFGAGTSHTPMLNMTAEEWPLFEEVDRHRAHLHTDGRAATYDDLLAAAPASVQARDHARQAHKASRRGDGGGRSAARRAGRRRSRRGDRRRRRPQGGLSRRQHAERAGLSRRDDRQRAEPDRTQPRRQRRRTAAAQLDAARRRALLRGERDAALSCPCRPRQSSDHGPGRGRVRRVVGQRAAGGRGRGARLRLRPSPSHEGRRFRWCRSS